MHSTESAQAQHAGLDEYDTPQLVAALVGDPQQAVTAVQRAQPELVRAVDAAVARLEQGGRLLYLGAGTSGRLGVLDGVELTPTFHWPAERALGFIAGGRQAMFAAVEFAEDDAELGARDVQQAQVTAVDVVILLAASGATPYVLGALRAARSAGALTIGMANNSGAPVTSEAEIGITLDTGPEVISGSTRLKAGTAQKIALNSLSSAIMVRLHKVHGNLMVDVQANNHKLRGRAVQLVVRLAGVDDSAAQQALEANGWRVKTAVVALRLGLDGPRADAHLAKVQGRLRTALETPAEA